MKSKHKKIAWFIKVRGSYLPNNIQGWLTYIPFIAYVSAVPVIASTQTDEVLLALLIILPNWVAATTVMTYVASKHS